MPLHRFPVRIFLLILALGLGNAAFAAGGEKQEQWYVVDTWQQRHGLPQNFVRSVIQTHDGYIWVGTNAGLARFDGVHFTNFDSRDQNKIRENDIRALLETSDGSLWVGTHGGGLSRYKDGKFQVYTVENGLVNNFVDALVQGPDGTIWIGTEGGLGRFKDGQFDDFKKIPGGVGAVLRLFPDEDGTVWIGTADGELFHFQNGKFFREKIAQKSPTSTVRSIVRGRGKDRSLWVGTTDGLFKIEPGQTTRYSGKEGLSSNYTEFLLSDRDGSLFVATDRGIDQFDPERNSFNNIFVGADVNSLCRDHEGSLWVGFARTGLLRLLPGPFISYTIKDGLSDLYAATVHQDKQNAIWVGTKRGLDILEAGTVTPLPESSGLPRIFIGAMAEDQEGRAWVGTANGLYRSTTGGPIRTLHFELIRDEAVPTPLFFRAILPARDGAVWISLDQQGLVRYQDGKFRLFTTVDGLSSNLLRSLVEDRDGSLWIATRGGGLNHFKDGKFSSYQMKDGLVNDSVVALYMDEDNVLWIGTRQGVNRFKNGSFAQFTIENGLYSNFVLGLVEDRKGGLWMGCRNGLFRVRKQQLNDFAEKKINRFDSVAYGTEQGLSSTVATAGHQSSSLCASDGRVWFALDGGVSVVDPEKLLTNRTPPPVHLEHVTIDRKGFELAGEIEAPPGRGDIEISYTGLSYIAPEKVRFKYKLDGYDHDWVDAGDRRAAFYSNIPPGRYRFHVIAANNDGLWNEEGAEVDLKLAPHFFETAWFYVLGASSVALAIFIGVRLRVRNLRLRERQLESTVNERTAELRKQKETMQRQRAFLRQIIDLNPSIIFAKDREGRFTLGNQALAEFYGVRVDDLIGKTEADFNNDPDDIERIKKEEARILESEVVMREELIQDRNGKQQWRQIIKIPLVSPDDQSRQILGVATDITLQKQAALQMGEAKEAAEAATRAKSAFLANMSHEIRTPMNAVIGMTGLLIGTNLSPEQKEYVETIRMGGDSLLTVINDILDFSKIESGKLNLEHKPFSLRVCVDEALDLLAARAFDKGLELICDVRADTPQTILGDITRLRQVLVNLIGNAVKFTGSGEVAVEIDSRLLEGSRYEIHFAVRDTGIGIPDDKVGLLFQSFSQVDDSTTKLFGGTGLGLAISKRLTEMMDGKISVRSRAGYGSTFEFTIQVETTQTVEAEYPPHLQALLQQKRLLLVDDNQTSRAGLQRQLSKWGIVVETVSSGREALERIDLGAIFDGMVVDMTMPEMNGAELIDRLRTRTDWRDKVVVMLMSGAANKQNLGERDVDEYRISQVSKPIKPNQLRHAIEQLFVVRVPAKSSLGKTSQPTKAKDDKPVLRVLLAEDNLVNQKVALRMLDRLGYKADVAGNGLEALDALGRQPYDLVLMDMQMPQMDGLETTRQIHQRMSREQRPWIIAMTANAMEGDREMCLRAGMDDYVSKPVKVSDLEAALKKAEAHSQILSRVT